MYNLYIEEKKKEKEKLEEKERKKILKYKQKFRSKKQSINIFTSIIGQIPLIYKNYENRVKEFITEMANPEYQIVVKDISSKITNPREEMMKDTKLRKPFIFKGYITEADRIKDVVHNNRLLYNLPDYPDSHELKKDKLRNKSGEITYNFYINIPKRLKTINSNDDINDLINKDKEINNKILLSKKDCNETSTSSNNNTKVSFWNFKNHFSSLRKLSTTEKNKYNELIKKNLIYQPQMRFRARTDLERVYDILNLQHLINEKDRQIIEKQLNNVELYKYKKPKELLNIQHQKSSKPDENKIEDKKYNILPNPIIEEEKKEKEKIQKKNLLYGQKNLYYEPKNNNLKLWARKENLNDEARKFLSSYHYKTHFKATEEAQFNINSKINSKSVEQDLKTCLMIPNIFKTESNELINKNRKINLKKNKKESNLNYVELDKKKDIFNFGEDLYKDEHKKEKDIDYNKLVREYQNNPIFDNVKKVKISADSLRNLSQIAFKTADKSVESEEEEKSEDYEGKSINGFHDRYMKDNNKNNNLVDNENIHNTAKLVLGECKLYSPKSKYNNSFLKTGTGKSMITKGLSINEFLKKYSLSNK